jgi:hypothetical protein
VLRRDFGIGYHEAWNVLPAWEVDALLQQHNADDGRATAGRPVLDEAAILEHRRVTGG